MASIEQTCILDDGSKITDSVSIVSSNTPELQGNV